MGISDTAVGGHFLEKFRGALGILNVAEVFPCEQILKQLQANVLLRILGAVAGDDVAEPACETLWIRQ